MSIDICYDFRRDLMNRKFDVDEFDADRDSYTLRNYHQILWNKKLPNGEDSSFSEKLIGTYRKLRFYDINVSSDTMINCYTRKGWRQMKNIINNIPNNEIETFYKSLFSIGNYIIFPSDKIDDNNTINQERGWCSYIKDRFDITLECIRLYYNGENSPLFNVINRYNNYFKLFNNFNGYCDFFFLQDLTKNGYSEINFFLPFDNFLGDSCPSSVDEYYIYKNNSTNFIDKRNKRIVEYINKSS
ncbi:hypothetical protein AGMMS50268_40690 [Spirochaetia bacterium]|nr:hypothetical protein AGMMS50268_40690 [Spirochaetia bacterium]